MKWLNSRRIVRVILSIRNHCIIWICLQKQDREHWTFFLFFYRDMSLWPPKGLTEGRSEGSDWMTFFWYRLIDWWWIIDTVFSILLPNNHENSYLDVSWSQNYKDQKSRYTFFQVTPRDIRWCQESSDYTRNLIYFSVW